MNHPMTLWSFEFSNIYIIYPFFSPLYPPPLPIAANFIHVNLNLIFHELFLFVQSINTLVFWFCVSFIICIDTTHNIPFAEIKLRKKNKMSLTECPFKLHVYFAWLNEMFKLQSEQALFPNILSLQEPSQS